MTHTISSSRTCIGLQATVDRRKYPAKTQGDLTNDEVRLMREEKVAGRQASATHLERAAVQMGKHVEKLKAKAAVDSVSVSGVVDGATLSGNAPPTGPSPGRRLWLGCHLLAPRRPSTRGGGRLCRTGTT